MGHKLINKQRWNTLKFYVIGWTIGFVFLSIVRGVGTQELGNIQFEFSSSILLAITLGPIMGIVSGLAQIITEERIYKNISLRKFLLIRFLYTSLFVVLLVIMAFGINSFYFGINIDLQTFAFDKGSGAIYFYVLSLDILLSVLRQVNLMLGEGNLRKLLLGQFYTPHEEERIFMFLDLQASTTLAERLGHVTYSKLIQDCFNDLGIAAANNGEIYQYVGDEAVLTWRLDEGIHNQNLLKTFYKFKQQLEKKREYYENTYNCLPFFKAGAHVGIVTVTEVGKYKKEIAYHGDTINTAARIQGQCNSLGSELLVSETLKNQLDGSHYIFEHIGSVPLKGKKGAVSICSVRMDTI